MVYNFFPNLIVQCSMHSNLIMFELGLIVENFLHFRFWRRMVCHNSGCVMPFLDLSTSHRIRFFQKADALPFLLFRVARFPR